jgi:hypothetical protein
VNKCIHNLFRKKTMPDGTKRSEEFCKALKDICYKDMLREGKCGSYDCPFYKEHEDEVR